MKHIVLVFSILLLCNPAFSMMLTESEEALQNYTKLLSVVRNRIKKKKDLNEPIKGNRCARTPLTEAATADFYTPITELLLDHDADPNKADLCGTVPLYNALSHNSIQNIQILLRKKANPNYEYKPHSPQLLLFACRAACVAYKKQCFNSACKIKAVTALLKSGADPNASQEDQSCIQALINCPLNIHPEIQLTEGKEKKLLAIRKDLIKLLIDHGANLPLVNAHTCEIIHPQLELTNYAFGYARFRLLKTLCYPSCPGRNSSPFMNIPKELVKMVIFMAYPSHSPKT